MITIWLKVLHYHIRCKIDHRPLGGDKFTVYVFTCVRVNVVTCAVSIS